MDTLMLQQYFFALIEGIGLVLSPCILPVLPLVLAASATGGTARPLGVIAGFVLAFTAFAIFSRALVQATGIDTEMIRHISLALLLLVGFAMLSQKLGARFMQWTEGLARSGSDVIAKYDSGNGFKSGVLIGLLIGFVWTPCAGPIMAAAIVQVVQAETDFHAALITLMFVTGAGIPMLILSLFGRRLAGHLGQVKKHADTLRRVLGGVIILMAVLIWSGADIALLSQPPGSTTRFDLAATELQEPLETPYIAPNIKGITHWFNGDALDLADLRGKVVLIDFWTYSCINCVRTLPYVTAWERRYRSEGLVVIGIHTPEFPFEKKPENVQAAIEKHNIEYAVGMDNDWQTWRSFDNHYWPAHYLIDKQGRVVYTHFGEGGYARMENNIRYLLGIHDAVPGAEIGASTSAAAGQSPETYLGYRRAANFVPVNGIAPDTETAYKTPVEIPLHHWSLNGDWIVEQQSATALASGASLQYRFQGGRVFLVMGTLDGNPVDVRVSFNGKPASAGAAGKDVKNSMVTVTGETLYELLALPTVQQGLLEIEADRAGLQVYAFTFGK